MTARRPKGTLKAGEGIAVPLAAGEQLRVVNLRGSQVVDMWAVSTNDPGEYLSMEHTHVALAKLVPGVGDDLYSSRRRPLMTLTEDTSPGVHDTLMAACDEERYRLLGATKPHANCAENYRLALADLGMQTPVVPAPLNLFMNIPWREDGSLEFRPTVARAGDHLTLTARADLVVVLSACPMDMNPINGYEPSDVGLEVLSP
jgi:uncharacterized protein YcgI (DUF1989 family)